MMLEQITQLNCLPIGSKGMVRELLAQENTKRRFLDLGLINNTLVEAVCKSPTGDPVAYHIRGAVIALRSEEASKIIIEMKPENKEA